MIVNPCLGTGIVNRKGHVKDDSSFLIYATGGAIYWNEGPLETLVWEIRGVILEILISRLL